MSLKQNAQGCATAIMGAGGIEPNVDNAAMIRNAFTKLTN